MFRRKLASRRRSLWLMPSVSTRQSGCMMILLQKVKGCVSRAPRNARRATRGEIVQTALQRGASPRPERPGVIPSDKTLPRRPIDRRSPAASGGDRPPPAARPRLLTVPPQLRRRVAPISRLVTVRRSLHHVRATPLVTAHRAARDRCPSLRRLVTVRRPARRPAGAHWPSRVRLVTAQPCPRRAYCRRRAAPPLHARLLTAGRCRARRRWLRRRRL